MLRWLVRGYVLDRLFRSLTGPPGGPGGRPVQPYRQGRQPYGYGRQPRPMYGARRPRGRTGFWGPVPYYSTRTRRGSQVSVGGCCLPIPLGLLVSTSGLAVRSLRRRTTAGR